MCDVGEIARWKYVGEYFLWITLRSLRPEEHGSLVSPTLRHAVVLN